LKEDDIEMATPVIVVALESELEVGIIPNYIPVVYTGVGKVNAAIATSIAISNFSPSLIINFGTAGKISADCEGLVRVQKVLQRDMNAEPLSPRGITPLTNFPNQFTSCETGVTCGTGDSFVTSRDQWLHDNSIDIVDMELFAIAAVAYRFNIPWDSYKFISDDANEGAADEWQKKVSHGRNLFVLQLKALGII